MSNCRSNGNESLGDALRLQLVEENESSTKLSLIVWGWGKPAGIKTGTSMGLH